MFMGCLLRSSSTHLAAWYVKAADHPKPNGDGGAVDPPREHKKDHQHGGGGNDGGSGDCDPAIKGLIKRLPAPDSDWPLEKQAKWLLAVSHAFDVVYPREDDGRSLKIEIVQD
jgi:hypothetical protein